MRRTLLLIAVLIVACGVLCAQAMRGRTLIWEDPDNTGNGITKYTVYWANTPGGPYTLGKVEIPVGTLTATVTLGKGTYYFVVTASNPDSESPYSNEATTTIYDNARKPINFKIVVTP